VRVDDPNNLLPKSENPGAVPVLLCGVRTATGRYIAAQLQPNAARTRTYEVTVPQGIPLRLSFSSRRVRIIDSAGVPQTIPHVELPFQVPVGQKQFVFNFSVRNLTPQEASSIVGK
jgi:hypothetical protein